MGRRGASAGDTGVTRPETLSPNAAGDRIGMRRKKILVYVLAVATLGLAAAGARAQAFPSNSILGPSLRSPQS